MLPKTRRRDRRTWLVGALALAGWLTASLTGFASPALARTCGSITISGGTVSPGTGTPDHHLHVRRHRLGHDRRRTDLGPSQGPRHLVRPRSDGLGLDRWRALHGDPRAPGRVVGRTSSARGPPAGSPAITRMSTRRGSSSLHRRRHRHRRRRPTPTPTPTPKPTAAPTPKPTATAIPRSTPKPTPKPTRRPPRRPPNAQTDPQADEGPDQGADEDQGGDTAPGRGRRLPERGSPTESPSAPRAGVVGAVGGGGVGRSWSGRRGVVRGRCRCSGCSR